MEEVGIHRLPLEVLSRVAQDVGGPSDRSAHERKDLLALALTDRTFNVATTRVLWSGVKLYDNEGAHKCFEVLAESGRLAGMVRSIDLAGYRVCPSEEVRSLLALVLRKMPMLQVLDAPLLVFYTPGIIAALCAHEESKLVDLWLGMYELDEHMADDLSALHDLKLNVGQLQLIELMDPTNEIFYPSKFEGRAFPQAYVDAVARILGSSAQSIRRLSLHEGFQKACLSTITHLPELESLDVLDICLDLPCFAPKLLSPNLVSLKLFCDCNFFHEGKYLRSFAERFSSLKSLTVVLRNEALTAARLFDAGKYCIAYLPHLESVQIEDVLQLDLDNLDYHPVPDHLYDKPEAELSALNEWSKHNAVLHEVDFSHADLALPAPLLRTWIRKNEVWTLLSKICPSPHHAAAQTQ